MPMTRVFKTLGAALLLAAFAAPVLAQEDPVVARVGSEEIRKSDVTREMAALPPQLQQIPVEQLYPQLLERMIDAKLLLAEAKKSKLNETQDFKDRVKRAEERIMTDMALREKVKPMITEAKVKEKYDGVVAKIKPEDEVRARHILVKTEKEAKDIIEQINKGGDFAKIAAEKSTDKGSAEQGGDLGYFVKNLMVPAFADAAFAMKTGEVSKTPVKTDFGYHVIKVEDRRKSQPVALDKVRPQIEAQLGDEMANQYLDSLRKGVKIERFTLEGKPAAEAPPAAPATPATEKK